MTEQEIVAELYEVLHAESVACPCCGLGHIGWETHAHEDDCPLVPYAKAWEEQLRNKNGWEECARLEIKIRNDKW